MGDEHPCQNSPAMDALPQQLPQQSQNITSFVGLWAHHNNYLNDSTPVLTLSVVPVPCSRLWEHLWVIVGSLADLQRWHGGWKRCKNLANRWLIIVNHHVPEENWHVMCIPIFNPIHFMDDCWKVGIMDLGMDLESSLLWIPMPLKLVAMPPLCIKRLPAFTSRDPPLDKTTQVVTSIPVILMRDEFQPRMYNPQFICRGLQSSDSSNYTCNLPCDYSLLSSNHRINGIQRFSKRWVWGFNFPWPEHQELRPSVLEKMDIEATARPLVAQQIP